MRSSRRFQGDGGFTLPELLMVIAIGSIIILALSGVLIAVFKTQDATTQRLAASKDTQLVATWLPLDVSSAAISGWSTNAAAASLCTGTTAGGLNVIQLPYAATTGDTAQVANYRLEQDPKDSTKKDLVRYQCLSGSAFFSRIVLANTLLNQSDAAVATPDCTGINAAAGTCNGRLSVTMLIKLSNGQNVSYSSDGRTGTTLGAFATTTTVVATTTTSTTVAATTTTTLPCTASATSDRSTVARVGGNGAQKDKLSNNVNITVTTSGSCTGVTLNIQYTRKYQSSSFQTTTPVANGTAQIAGSPQGANWDPSPSGSPYVISVTGASNTPTLNLTVT